MLKVPFLKGELENICEIIYFTDIQEKILKLRRQEYSRQQIADELIYEIDTIDKEIAKIVKKIVYAYEKNLITLEQVESFISKKYIKK